MPKVQLGNESQALPIEKPSQVSCSLWKVLNFWNKSASGRCYPNWTLNIILESSWNINIKWWVHIFYLELWAKSWIFKIVVRNQIANLTFDHNTQKIGVKCFEENLTSRKVRVNGFWVLCQRGWKWSCMFVMTWNPFHNPPYLNSFEV